MKLVVGIFIMFFGIAYLRDFRVDIKKEKLAFLPVGFISGILHGSITLSGPPVVITLTNQEVPKRAFRANMIAYFMLLNLITLPFHQYGGLFTDSCLKLSFLLLPGMLIGAFLGTRLVKKVDEASFRKLVLVLVTVSGLVSMLAAIIALI